MSLPEQGHAPDANTTLFVVDGEPASFYLHRESIKEPGARKALKDKIEKHGGVVVDDVKDATVLLYNPNKITVDSTVFDRAYAAHSDPDMRKVWVRPVAMVRNWITNKHFLLVADPKQAMPGASPGARTPFTKEDEYHLAQYFTRVRPDPKAGGLLGRRLYEDLINLITVLPDEYAWVKRHSWQSWRDHYKHNIEKIHGLMADYKGGVGEIPEKNEYRPDRRILPRTGGLKQVIDLEYSEEEEEELGDEEVQKVGRKKQQQHAPLSPVAQSVSQVKGKHPIREVEESEEDEDRRGPPVHRPRPRPSYSRPHSDAIDNQTGSSGAQATAISLALPPQSSTQATLVASHPEARLQTYKQTLPEPNDEPSPPPIQKDGEEDMIEKYGSDFSDFPLQQSSSPPEQLPVLKKQTRAGRHRGANPEGESAARPAASRRRGIDRTAASPAPESEVPYRSARSRSRNVEPAPLPQKAKKRLRPNAEAPYRNTRSRSRSVEPAPLPQKPKKKSRKGYPLPPVVALSDIEEMTVEVLEKEIYSPIIAEDGGEDWEAEVQDEELDVQDQLLQEVVSVEPISASAKRRYANEEQEGAWVSATVQEVSVGPQISDSDDMDTDDGQTHDKLFTQPSQDLRAARALWGRKPESEASTKVQLPITPHRHRRGSSDRGSEVFPVPATAADQKFREMRNMEMASPYVPPSGSRAAQMVTGQKGTRK